MAKKHKEYNGNPNNPDPIIPLVIFKRQGGILTSVSPGKKRRKKVCPHCGR